MLGLTRKRELEIFLVRARIDKFYTGVKVPEAAKEAILKSWEQERQVTMIPFVAKA